jgi:hypothetical protein
MARNTINQKHTNNNKKGSRNQKHTMSTANDDVITVGRLVDVASRTWPGINKTGGIARVTLVQFHPDTKVPTHVNVTYMVESSKEKRVPVEYVKLAPDYETKPSSSSLRNRSLLLGRCLRCGSLRTDCGSCDWAVEEEQVQVEQERPTNPPTRRSRTVPKQSSRSRIKSAFTHQHASLSSSSEDEEDVALQELLEQGQKCLRYLGINKAERKDLDLDSESSSSERTSKENKAKLRQATPNEVDTDSSDDDLAELVQRGQQRHQRYLHHRSQWNTYDNSSNKDDQPPFRRRNHQSVLESATTPLSTTTTSQPPKSKHRRKLKKLSKRRRVTLDPESMDKDDVEDVAIRGASQAETPQKRVGPHAMDVEEVGVAESSSPESLAVPLPDTGWSSPDDSNRHSDMEQRPLSSYFDTIDQDGAAGEESTLALSQFIQPEGQEVAENLPQDTLDRTKALPYPDLPRLFDTMVTQIEDEVLPDFKLRIAELQRQWRQVQSPRTLADTDDSYSKKKTLLEDCQQAWLQLRHRLIRNGTDQCRAALRRLMDDRLYRKHRKQLTTKQRKQCRGAGKLEVRNLRMDAVEDTVEGLVRKLKDLVDACEQHYDDDDDDSNDNSIGMANSSESESDDYETQDLVPLSTSEAATTAVDTSERPLAPFHPHMHASRVKITRKKTQGPDATKKRTRNKSGTTPCMRTRARASENRDVQSFTESGGSRRKSTPRTRRQRDQTTEEGNRAPEPGSSEQGQALNKTPSDSIVTMEDTENSDAPQASRLRRSDPQDDDVPTFDLFEPATEETSTTGTARTNIRSRQNSSRRQSTTPSDLATNERSLQCDRVSISRRMQAFLDANTGDGLDWRADQGKVDTSQQDRKDRKRQGRQHPRPYTTQRGERDAGRGAQRERSKKERPRGEISSDQRMNDDMGDTMDDPELEQESPGGQIDVEELFSQLEDGRDRREEPVSVERSVSVSTICSELRRTYPNASRQSIALLDQVRSATTEDICHNSEGGFLRTAFDLLQNHGVLTLQELITTKSPYLGAHVRLLAGILRVLELEPNNDLLDPSHGLLFQVVLANRRSFFDFLVLQLVDSVCSLLHPEAWALKIQNRPQILRMLVPLRDALASVIPMTESVCRCIMEQLECQKWRVGPSGNHAFVSSVDPSDWRTFLHSGKFPDKPDGKFSSSCSRFKTRIISELCLISLSQM